MKSLVKFTAPKDFKHDSEVVWVNPDMVCAVYRKSEATVIHLLNDNLVFSNQTLDAVVKLVNDNARA